MEQDDARIIPINIEEEMKSSYIDYSMSVIVSRALPDIRDGLKPVHRRVLYGMSDLGLTGGASYKKSARLVGEVLGKYHPHGDSSVYDTMVRMAQPFSMRSPLVDGQGNFGSIDGDAAAAMRYTEARMTRIAEEMLRDIQKETVDFQENFDGSLEEPSVLPAAIPNLLLNGSDGIAVGMATKIPPHNLKETVDAVIAWIDDPNIDVDGLMKCLPAPDFPTGGIIYGYAGVQEAYRTGRGRIVMRARMHEEEIRADRTALVITEIPYQVNKSSLLEKIAHCVKEKRIEGISDLRDESDRDGLRIVVEIKNDAMPLVVKNQLYKYTQCQQSFGVNMVALVNGRPKTITLRDAVRHYVEHRHEIVERRTRFDLRKAQERAHILEGLTIALDHLDQVITIVRHSDDADAARENLMRGVYPEQLTAAQLERLGLPPADGSMFSLTESQADAILALRLSRLTGLERQKIEREYRDVLEEIVRLETILAERDRRMQIIKEELLDIQAKYADARRTEIDYKGGGDFAMEDMIEEEQVVVTISHQALIKRTSLAEYRQQGRGGVGKKGSGKRDEDYIEHMFVSSTHDYLLYFTDHGKCYRLRVFEIPEGSRTAKGRSIRNLIQIDQEDRVRTVLAASKAQFEDETFRQSHYVVMATRKGLVKKTVLDAFKRPLRSGIIALRIMEGDELIEARLTSGTAHVFLASSSGKAIRFDEREVRSMGRYARGVKGISLRPDEEAIGMAATANGEREILAISENGYGKRSCMENYSAQARGGKGRITIKTTPKTGRLVAIRDVTGNDDLMIITQNGMMIRMHVGGISVLGRNTQGVRLIHLKEGDSIADVTRLVTEDNGQEENAQEEEPRNEEQGE